MYLLSFCYSNRCPHNSSKMKGINIRRDARLPSNLICILCSSLELCSISINFSIQNWIVIKWWPNPSVDSQMQKLNLLSRKSSKIKQSHSQFCISFINCYLIVVLWCNSIGQSNLPFAEHIGDLWLDQFRWKGTNRWREANQRWALCDCLHRCRTHGHHAFGGNHTSRERDEIAYAFFVCIAFAHLYYYYYYCYYAAKCLLLNPSILLYGGRSRRVICFGFCRVRELTHRIYDQHHVQECCAHTSICIVIA